MRERRAGLVRGRGTKGMMVAAVMTAALTACAARPKPASAPVAQPAPAASPAAPAPGQSVLAAQQRLAWATVDGFVTALAEVLDQTADQVCACGEQACADEVLSMVAIRAGSAAIGYRLGKKETPELTALLEQMNRDDFQFATYLEKERPSWFEQFQARLQICTMRIAAASFDEAGEGAAAAEELDEELDDEHDEELEERDDAAAAPAAKPRRGAVKASYQPGGKRRR